MAKSKTTSEKSEKQKLKELGELGKKDIYAANAANTQAYLADQKRIAEEAAAAEQDEQD